MVKCAKKNKKLAIGFMKVSIVVGPDFKMKTTLSYIMISELQVLDDLNLY